MKNTHRCPDCGEWTTERMCDECTDIAHLFGMTVDQRLNMLGGAE